MSLPTKTQIQQLGFSLDGSPFCKVTTKPNIDINMLGFSLDGTPWWGHGFDAPTILGHIKAVNQVDWAKVKKFNGVSQVNIKTIINVEG